MIDYEILLMLDPELTEERQNEIVARLRKRVEEDGGTWDTQEPWGRRRLAYEIDHKTDGVYHLLTFASTPETLAEVTRLLKITDGVMRHLAVRRVSTTGTMSPPPADAAAAPTEERRDDDVPEPEYVANTSSQEEE